MAPLCQNRNRNNINAMWISGKMFNQWVSITRKCHNRRPHTSPRHHEEKTQNNKSHMTVWQQLKWWYQLSHPQLAYCKTKNNTKYCIIIQGPTTKHTQTVGATINNGSTTAERTVTKALLCYENQISNANLSAAVASLSLLWYRDIKPASIQSRATIGPPVKRHLNCVPLVGR